MAELAPVTFSAESQEGTQSMISQWFKKIGDEVKENEPLVEVSTDKVNVEIASPTTGILREIIKKDGEQITPGEVLGKIEPGATGAHRTGAPAPAAKAAAASASAAAPGGSAELSPAVRKLLKEHGLEASQVTGTGKGGRITAEDVTNFVASKSSGGKSCASAGSVSAGSVSARSASSRKVPHSPMRKQIAHHMVQSLLHTAPHVTSVFEADLTSVSQHRERMKNEFEAKGVRLTFTAYFVQAAVKALQAVPEVNSRYYENELEILGDLHIGIAAAIEGSAGQDSGLIVPVLHQAQKLSLFDTAKQLGILTAKAREGALSPDEVKGGTFTISNHGVSGSLFAAPIIINQPQSAILGIGKLEKRACVIESNGKESIEIRPKVYVTLTLDHRVLDGFKANAFLTEFVKTLEGAW